MDAMTPKVTPAVAARANPSHVHPACFDHNREDDILALFSDQPGTKRFQELIVSRADEYKISKIARDGQQKREIHHQIKQVIDNEGRRFVSRSDTFKKARKVRESAYNCTTIDHEHLWYAADKKAVMTNVDQALFWNPKEPLVQQPPAAITSDDNGVARAKTNTNNNIQNNSDDASFDSDPDDDSWESDRPPQTYIQHLAHEKKTSGRQCKTQKDPQIQLPVPSVAGAKAITINLIFNNSSDDAFLESDPEDSSYASDDERQQDIQNFLLNNFPNDLATAHILTTHVARADTNSGAISPERDQYDAFDTTLPPKQE